MRGWTIPATLTALLLLSGNGVAAESAYAPGHPVRGLLDKYCFRCHGNKKKPKGDLSIEALGAVTTDNAKTWEGMLHQIVTGEMPPKKKPQPTETEIKQVAEWIKTRLKAIGRESDIDHKLLQPSYGNLISHERLFDGSITVPAYGPPRLWRLHPEAYAAFLEGFGRELGKGGPISRPFKVAEGKGLPSNYAALNFADEATLGQLMLNCKMVATLQTVGFKRLEKDRKTKKETERIYRKPPPSFAAIMDADTEDEATDAQLHAAVAEQFKRSPAPRTHGFGNGGLYRTAETIHRHRRQGAGPAHHGAGGAAAS